MPEAIGQGALARNGALDNKAIAAADALLEDIANSDVSTVRVLFTDPHGVLRGKTLVASAFASAFRSGVTVPSTLMLKDTSMRTAFPVWDGDGAPMHGAGDITLVPDPHSFRKLPWTDNAAWILCDTVMRDGSAVPVSPRTVLQRSVEALEHVGLRLSVGLEVEFHVFEVTDPNLDHTAATMPARPPETRNLAGGYQLLSETVHDRLDPVMEELRLVCLQLGLPLRSMEVEMGPSQFEFTFDPADPMTQADRMVMFRTAVKEVCARANLHASFMCQPKLANAAASGWHVHQSLSDLKGQARMIPPDATTLTPQARGWIAGLLAHARESCLLTTPTVNGYKRYQPYQLAPDRIAWGYDNRGTMVRALMQPGDPASRVENRVGEPTANPYYMFAAQILSGLSGIRDVLPLPDPVTSPYAADAPLLPATLGEAIEAFDQSKLYREALGDDVVSHLVTLKRSEWQRYLAHVSDWEHSEYFGLF